MKRKAHRRRMKTVVHQPLGNVHITDAAQLFDRTHINDALMGNKTAVAGIEHRKVRRKSLRDVVGVEDGDSGRLAQTIAAHHADVGVRNRQDARRTLWRSTHRTDLAATGQERREL